MSYCYSIRSRSQKQRFWADGKQRNMGGKPAIFLPRKKWNHCSIYPQTKPEMIPPDRLSALYPNPRRFLIALNCQRRTELVCFQKWMKSNHNKANSKRASVIDTTSELEIGRFRWRSLLRRPGSSWGWWRRWWILPAPRSRPWWCSLRFLRVAASGSTASCQEEPCFNTCSFNLKSFGWVFRSSACGDRVMTLRNQSEMMLRLAVWISYSVAHHSDCSEVAEVLPFLSVSLFSIINLPSAQSMQKYQTHSTNLICFVLNTIVSSKCTILFAQ